MNKSVKIAVLFTVLLSAWTSPVFSDSGKLRVGITLHPYYSFVKNIVGEAAEVVPLIDSDADSHAYNPRPEDIRNVMTMDCLVVNGIGHDEFAFEILTAAQLDNGRLPLIYANDGVSLIPVAGYNSVERIVNPHTFISITASIQQIYNISSQLQKLDPSNADTYRRNTRAYTKKLRGIKAEYMEKIAGIRNLDFSCATIHGGYDYLLQEFGLHVTAVVEPSHGANPTASQLKETIDKINALDVEVLFTEMNFQDQFAETIEKETGVSIAHLSHLTSGSYSAERFEIGIRENLENLTDTLLESAAR